jgi:ABC-type multidrug transport system ATPase subunit
MRLWVEQLTKNYGNKCILKKLDAEFRAGEAVAIVGVNGVGKTTLLECLAQVRLPDSGRIMLDDQPIQRQRIDLRRRLFYLPGIPEPVFGTPLTFLCSTLAAFGKSLSAHTTLPEDIVELLTRFEIEQLVRQSWTSLSRGQQYKVQIVSLLAVHPEVWLLDEPFSAGMDPLGIRLLRVAIREAVEQRQRIVVFTTQNLEVAARAADRVVILHQQRIVASVPTIELLQGNSMESLDENFEKLIRNASRATSTS